MSNNIFDYATSELSQDAFLCWCVNWFNDPSNPKLREMSIELLNEFTDIDKIESVRIYRQFSRRVSIPDESGEDKKVKIPVKIDVLFIVNNSVAVILEDKTTTSEHDEQIQRYEKGLNQIINESKKGEEFYNIQRIQTVFLKTGFMFDNDKCVEANKIVTSEVFLKILSKYLGNSEILDSYVTKLKSDWQFFNEELKNYEGSDGSFWDWKIAKHHVAQYWLMRDIFPADTFWPNKSLLYKVRHGTSRGRPWTQTTIWQPESCDSSKYVSVFWRIDTDSRGPYLSLRFYEVMDKEDSGQTDNHKSIYCEMSNTMKSIIDKNNFFAWKDVKPYKNKEKCYESEIIHINLIDILKDCEETRNKLMDTVRQITYEFLAEIKNKGIV